MSAHPDAVTIGGQTYPVCPSFDWHAEGAAVAEGLARLGTAARAALAGHTMPLVLERRKFNNTMADVLTRMLPTAPPDVLDVVDEADEATAIKLVAALIEGT